MDGQFGDTNNLLNNLGAKLDAVTQAGQGVLLNQIFRSTQLINKKLGAEIAGGGISGFLGRLPSSLGVEIAFSI